MNRSAMWILVGALLLALAGCSKDDVTPVGPVSGDRLVQKKNEVPPKSDWGEMEDIDLSSLEPFFKSYPPPVKKGGLLKTSEDPPIVINGGFEDGFAGWTVSVSGFGVVFRDPDGVIRPHPALAWYVGATDPYTSYYVVPFAPFAFTHSEPLAHSGNAGASALENRSTVHQMYQDITLPSAGDLRLDVWLRWKNYYSQGWLDQSQDIVITLRRPSDGTVLATVFKASTAGLPTFSGGGNSTTANYELRSADISEYRGQTVRLYFDIRGNSSILLVDLDDIEVVQILSNRPPVADAGDDQTVECTSHSGASVTLNGSGSTDPDNDLLTYSWTWSSGSATGVNPSITLPLGTHTITLTVDDGKGGTATDEVVITVQDTQAPLITLNGNNPTTLECPTPYVEPGASVSDLCDPSPGFAITANVNSSVVGTYTVIYTATDASGNTATATRTVNVIDTTPPTIVLNGENPTRLEVPATYTELGASVSDACDPSPAVTIEGTVDGSTVGTYTVVYTASDLSGNTSTLTRSVIVEDTRAPILSCFVTTSSLWPPKHDLVNVGFGVYVSDDGDTAPDISVKVYSDEQEDVETGDGNYSPDARGLAAGSLRLRAERNGEGDGRVYLIVVTATDKFGNKSFHCCTVVVPHSQSKAAVNAVNAEAAAASASCGLGGSPLTPFMIGEGPVIGPKQ